MREVNDLKGRLNDYLEWGREYEHTDHQDLFNLWLMVARDKARLESELRIRGIITTEISDRNIAKCDPEFPENESKFYAPCGENSLEQIRDLKAESERIKQMLGKETERDAEAA
jgi:hypothetical protein